MIHSWRVHTWKAHPLKGSPSKSTPFKYLMGHCWMADLTGWSYRRLPSAWFGWGLRMQEKSRPLLEYNDMTWWGVRDIQWTGGSKDIIEGIVQWVVIYLVRQWVGRSFNHDNKLMPFWAMYCIDVLDFWIAKGLSAKVSVIVNCMDIQGKMIILIYDLGDNNML